MLKNYLISSFDVGLQNNLEPWILPENAFETLTNAYVWRGRIKKRFGTSFIGDTDLDSRLRIDIGTTDGNGDLLTTVPGAIFSIGQNFSVGTEVFTVVVLGVPGVMLTTGAATTMTYNTTTGALDIQGADATTTVFFYPSDPVMGLRHRETVNVNFEDIVGFDTQFAYERVGGAWDRLGTAIWTGTNSDFFWTVNYRGASSDSTVLYVTNFVAADNIKFLDVAGTWTTLVPQLDAGATRTLETAKIIVSYKDRLVVLNTVEDEGGGDLSFVNRARYSQNGVPTDPLVSWLDDTPGRGGFIDASTKEAIITAEFVKDELVVYFERSTWKLIYTGIKALPFRWQQLNSELGCESTFSIIGFDKGAVGVGNVGVHTCNSVNVERIDEKIPNEVFRIHNGNDGTRRVYGIRDYFNELVYWTFPDLSTDPVFPTRVLVWNYQNGSWAFFNDTFTCFGYFQTDEDLQWSELGKIYGTWAEWNDAWNASQSQSRFPDIVAGNQQGYTFQVNVDRSFNEQSLTINDMTPASDELIIINHNLLLDEYILVKDAQGITSLNGIVFKVVEVVDVDTVRIDTVFTGTYTGGGTVARVSNLDIRSKQWNPGTPVGLQFSMPYMDFLLDRTTNGEVSLDYYLDSSFGESIQDQVIGDILLGSNVLFTQPETDVNYQPQQEIIWHRYNLIVEGSFIQIRLFMNDTQIRDLDISQSAFVMQAIIMYVEQSGRIIG